MTRISRNRMSRWLAATLTLSTLFAAPSALIHTDRAEAAPCSCAIGDFQDLNDADAWARPAMQNAQRDGIFTGGPEHRGYPQSSITRAEMAIVLVRMNGLAVPDAPASSFADVPASHWGHRAIEAVRNAGLMSGDGDGRFRPDAPVSNEEFAVLLARALGLKTAGKGFDALPYADTDSIRPWARPAVQATSEDGLFFWSETHFRPQAPVKRQEVAAAVMRTIFRHEIQATVDAKAKAVRTKNKAAYLDTLLSIGPEYEAEQSHWFDDIAAGEITDYRLEILDVQPSAFGQAHVTLRQSYRLKGTAHSTVFTSVYSEQNGRWLDEDIAFRTKKSDHFDIRYLGDDAAIGDKLAAEAELAYAGLQKRLPFRHDQPIMIKAYDDLELLRQSVKPSFAWQFAGWYEYPESIKTTTVNWEHRPYATMIRHELVHLITIKQTRNNMPYWLSEGIATYYQGDHKPVFLGADAYIPLANLETTDLERLTDRAEIDAYYNRSAVAVRFLIETYGEDKMDALLTALGRSPLREGTVGHADNNAANNDLFHTAVTDVLDLSYADLDANWQAWYAKQTDERVVTP